MKGIKRILIVLTAAFATWAISFLASPPGSSSLAPAQGSENTVTEVAQANPALTEKSQCYITYDAGSSGTRLYIYEQQGADLIEHEGPKVSALADPVREIRGKTWQDADAVTTEVAAALDDIQTDGPLDEGKPKWQGFDWPNQCQVVSASTYATAGMRIAEYENRQRSGELWQMLAQKIQAKVGTSAIINTRTLSGYEEGLFAWLAVGDAQKNDAQDSDYGIVEMGGASSQVTFSCPECNTANDAVKDVVLGDKTIRIYSYSFLGLGTDEAPKTLGFPQSCAYGVGETQKDWQPEDCASQLEIQDEQGIRDPYNFDGDGRGTHRSPAINPESNPLSWNLTGALSYMEEDDINAYCLNKSEGFDPEFSCFRSIYLRKYLNELNVPVSSHKMNVSWTKGATICSVNNCLQKPIVPVCRWSQKGCL